jgi:hypothetical protein
VYPSQDFIAIVEAPVKDESEARGVDKRLDFIG